MRVPRHRWLPIVTLLLAWQILAWQLPHFANSTPNCIKQIQQPILTAAGHAAFSLAESKPSDLKNGDAGKWLSASTAAFAHHLEIEHVYHAATIAFGITRIWLMHRALLL